MRFFHVSYCDLGDTFIFTPRVPASRSAYEDDVTERICVSTDPEKCLLGIEGVSSLSNWVLYMESGLIAFPEDIIVYELYSECFIRPDEKQVEDVYRTNEHWILEPTVGTKIGKIGVTKESIYWI